MFTRLARLALGTPRRVLLVAGAVALVALVVGGSQTAKLTSGLSDYDDPSSSTVAAQNAVLAATGVDPEQGILLVVRSDTPLSASPGATPPATVTAAAGLLGTQSGVVRVLDYATAHDPRMISKDRMSTYLVGEVGQVNEKTITADLQKRLAADPLLRGRTWLGGPTVANVQVSDVSTNDLGYAEAIAFPILLLLLLFVFRGVVAALIPLFGGIFAILLTLLGMSAVMTGVKLSVFALNLVLGLGLGLSIDFSLLMISRFREELARRGSIAEAVTITVTITGRTILFSTLTVSAALAALTVFPQRFLYSMGIAGVLTTLSAAVFALVVLPSILVALGTRLAKRAPRRSQVAASAAADQSRRWYRFAHYVMRHKIALAATATLGLLLLGTPFLGIKFTGVDSTVLGNGSSAGQVYTMLTQDFDAAAIAPVGLVITAPPTAGPALGAYADRIAAIGGVASVAPPQQLKPDLWEIDATLANAPLSPAAQSTFHRIQTEPAPWPVREIGQTAEFRALQNSLGAHLPLAIALIALTTLLLLFAMTGSVVLPIKALIMNALSLSAAFGILVMIFQWGNLTGLLHFTSQGALESTSPIILLALVFGLSTDYGVFLLGRIKEGHVRGLSSDEAVAVGLERTGRIVTSAAALLFVALGALAISRLTFIKELGVGSAVAVFLDASVVRAVLVPALMAILGRRNWWAPSALLRLRPALRLDGIEHPDPVLLPNLKAAEPVRVPQPWSSS